MKEKVTLTSNDGKRNITPKEFYEELLEIAPGGHVGFSLEELEAALNGINESDEDDYDFEDDFDDDEFDFDDD